MASDKAVLTENERKIAEKRLKIAAVLQYTLPGVPCVYYGDENGMEGHIDPFCRKCFDWEHLNHNLIEFYQKLGKLRSEYNVFKDGSFEELEASGGFIFYKRKKKDSVYVYVNNSSKSRLLHLPEKYEDCITNEIFEKELFIKPYSFGIFKKQK